MHGKTKASLILTLALTNPVVAQDPYDDLGYGGLDDFDSQFPTQGNYNGGFEPPDNDSYGSVSSCPNDLIACTIDRATAYSQPATRIKRALTNAGATCQDEADDLESELDDCLVDKQALVDENKDLQSSAGIFNDGSRFLELLAHYRQDAIDRCNWLDQTIVTVSGVRFKLFCNRRSRNTVGFTAQWRSVFALSRESCLEGCVREKTCWQIGFDMRPLQATYANRCDVLQNRQNPPQAVFTDVPQIRIVAVRL
ncbi:hypothetical protein BJY01DRAFT_248270 [Aspergillus pseudoustus]|uniref:Apple domain-containing protein n=1 Tax=Aspergillus pseudoustus TaxID=1810923 RepID=A0ABR4JVS1_9EURO